MNGFTVVSHLSQWLLFLPEHATSIPEDGGPVDVSGFVIILGVCVGIPARVRDNYRVSDNRQTIINDRPLKVLKIASREIH